MMHGTYAGCKEWNGWAMHPLVMYLSINTSNDLQKKKKKRTDGLHGIQQSGLSGYHGGLPGNYGRWAHWEDGCR